MGNLYAATPGQNPGVARIYIYIYIYMYFICMHVMYINMHWYIYNMYIYIQYLHIRRRTGIWHCTSKYIYNCAYITLYYIILYCVTLYCDIMLYYIMIIYMSRMTCIRWAQSSHVPMAPTFSVSFSIFSSMGLWIQPDPARGIHGARTKHGDMET